MVARIDITGQRYGRLVALKRTDYQSQTDSKNRSWWLFRCDCGKEKIICLEPVRSGATSSCGCFKIETIVARSVTNGRKRGRKTERTLKSYEHMKQRCYNENTERYPNYGGRGIKVCERWLESFDNFFQDMGNCPPKHSIERIDNNGNYEPGNCRWATNLEQSRNKRSNVWVEFKGQQMILKDFAKAVNVSYKRLSFLMRRDNLDAISASKLISSPFEG